uniref:Uncharacterized protein n=1 Tax=Thermosporothrix sp. COM3 TaxID=2490863 RepID=A0A455SHQ2_9CHLR|nr:hypothetical protein KTC_12000 [Thermosporothrix sp. COM3]
MGRVPAAQCPLASYEAFFSGLTARSKVSTPERIEENRYLSTCLRELLALF